MISLTGGLGYIPNEGGSEPVKGTMVLEKGGFHFYGVYRKDAKVKEYILDRLAEQEGVAVEDLVKECYTYINKEVYTFVPNKTPADSKWNFDLVNEDGTPRGVWIEMKSYTHTEDNLLLKWQS